MAKKNLFNQASKEWELGNLKEALQLFYEAAKQGDASAQNNLGFFMMKEKVRKETRKKHFIGIRRRPKMAKIILA